MLRNRMEGTMPREKLPSLPICEMPKDRMRGQPAGRIPERPRTDWIPMWAVGDRAQVRHCGNRPVRRFAAMEARA
jgi:hypothetical protein